MEVAHYLREREREKKGGREREQEKERERERERERIIMILRLGGIYIPATVLCKVKYMMSGA